MQLFFILSIGLPLICFSNILNSAGAYFKGGGGGGGGGGGNSINLYSSAQIYRYSFVSRVTPRLLHSVDIFHEVNKFLCFILALDRFTVEMLYVVCARLTVEMLYQLVHGLMLGLLWKCCMLYVLGLLLKCCINLYMGLCSVYCRNVVRVYARLTVEILYGILLKCCTLYAVKMLYQLVWAYDFAEMLYGLILGFGSYVRRAQINVSFHNKAISNVKIVSRPDLLPKPMRKGGYYPLFTYNY